jgi:outer membrane receptor protein involved in Fe transport
MVAKYILTVGALTAAVLRPGAGLAQTPAAPAGLQQQQQTPPPTPPAQQQGSQKQPPAQPQGQPQVPKVTQTVEVVATKVPESPHEVPASIEVFTGDQLHDLGATTLRDAMSLATGVEIAPGGDAGPASAVPEFWGLREFDAFLLVVDGVPWGGAFNPALTSLSLRDVERVEVLRGAAPVTYGATSFVGVIYVVHKPGTENRSYASANLGTLSSGGIAADLAMPSHGDWKSRLSADFDREGYKDPRTSYSQGHALWRSQKTEADRSMYFSADLNILRQHPASPTPREGTALSASTPLDANYNPDGAFMNENRIALNWGTERPFLRDTRLSVTASYTHSSQDQFRGFLQTIADTPDNATGLREKIGINDLYADAHVIFPEHRNLQLVAGMDFLFGKGSATGATFDYAVPLGGVPATTVTEPTTLDLGSEDRREFLGGYAVGEWKPRERLTVSAGLRLNLTFEEGGQGAGEVNEPAGQQDQGVTHVRPGASLGAIYGLWEKGVDHVRVFGDYRNTFKPAAFDFGLGEDVAGEGDKILNPETAQSYEGGVKVRALDARVDFEASVFRMDFNNLVVASVVAGLPALTNAGQTRFQGFEMSADYRMPRSITGRLTYSFHDGKFVDYVQEFDGVNQQLAGNRFEMSARHLLSASLLVSPSSGYFGSFVLKYTGNRYLDKRNTALAPAFVTVDLGVGYRFDKYELRLDARNITDRRDPISESELGDAQYYRMTPRQVRLTLGVRF